MAYAGYLIKVGTFTIPLSIIRAETYSAYESTTDIDSHVDANADLHRNVAPHKGIKAEFETVPMLTNTTFGGLMASIRSQYVSGAENEKKALASIYIPELDDYVSQYVYEPDIKPVLYYADESVIQYEQIRLAFIGYGY